MEPIRAPEHQTETLNDTYYRFYQNADDAVMSVELYRVEDSAMVGEALSEKTCMLDWQPMTADGADLVERAAWTLNESDEYAMVVWRIAAKRPVGSCPWTTCPLP